MNSSEIFDDLKVLSEDNSITKSNLLKLIQTYAKTISVQDLMTATTIMREDGKYIQKGYREQFLEVYVKYFIMRIKEIRDNTEYHDIPINKDKLIKSIDLLKFQYEKDRENTEKETKFPLIYSLVSLYATFILEESIHPVGCPFPGNLKVEKKNGIYYCPVKEKQKDTEYAVCNLCLAKQMPKI